MECKEAEAVQMIGLKGSRKRQLLNELGAMDLVSSLAATKNRRYVIAKWSEHPCIIREEKWNNAGNGAG